MYFFLVFFQPFGVNNYRPHMSFSADLLLGILPFIPVVYLTIYLSEKFLRPKLMGMIEKKAIIWYALEFLLVGTSTFLLYNAAGNFHDFFLKSYVLHLFEVSTILVFPFGATLFYYKFINLKKDYQEILSLTEGQSKMDELLHLTGDYKKDQIALRPKDIVHLISEDNYVGLNYIDGREIKKYLIRSTLSGIQKSLDSDVFFRCHRSHLVNLAHVISYRIDKTRMWIKLDGTDQEIPVSKSYQKNLVDVLKRKRNL